METKILKIDGMSCGHCVASVKNALENLKLEVVEVKIGSAKVNFDKQKISEAEIKNAIEDVGFEVLN